MKSANLICLLFCFLLFGCETDKNPIQTRFGQPENGDEGLDWGSRQKSINGQPCMIYYQKKSPSRTGWPAAPQWVIDASKAYLIPLFGEAYFHGHFELRAAEQIPCEARDDLKSEKFCTSFFYNITIRDFSTFSIVATYQDSLGNVVRPEGVVDRVACPLLGMPFNIEDTAAVAIAQNHGLQPGLRPWVIRFYYYYGELNRYVWNVMNSMGEDAGRSMIIDAQKDSVLMDNMWIITE
ncbi:MAG TPA: hypothetical protein VGB38_03490 [bacterium]